MLRYASFDARTLSVEGSFGVFGGVGGGEESENLSREVPFTGRSTITLRAAWSSAESLALTSGLCGGVSA